MSNEGLTARVWRLPFAPEWASLPVGVVAAAAVLLYAPVVLEMARVLAITVFCVCLWIATPVAPWFTALVGIGLIGLGFSTELALTGFSSPAIWLIVFGVLIGEATRDSGLAAWIEWWVLQQVPARYREDAGDTYRFLLVALSTVALAFAVVIPSALVRVLILAPILVTLSGRFESDVVRLGLVLGPLFATYYGGTGILTGSIGNIIVTGIAENAAGQTITWTAWLAQMGLLFGVGRSAAAVVAVYYLYRPPADTPVSIPDIDTAAGTGEERRMALFLGIGVLVWTTDFLHGLHPLYGALLVVLLAYLPGVGTTNFETVRKADFTIVFFVGAIFAIAEGLTRTGFTDLAARTILNAIPADAPLALVLVAVVITTIALTFLMEGLAVASVLTPVLVSFADGAGVALSPILMIEAAALGTYFFPYQSAVLVAMLSQDAIGARELIRTTVVVSVLSLVILFPFQIGLFVLLY